MDTMNSERYWILDQVVGWQDTYRKGLTLTKTDGHFTLEPLPGDARPLLDSGSEKEFRCPAALAPEPCGRLLMVDAALHRVKRVHYRRLPAEKKPWPGMEELSLGETVETLPALGREGSRPRRFREPRGMALLPSGAIVVADTGNHRVQVFSPPPYALLQVWGASDPLGRSMPGASHKQFRQPWAVAADECGTVYIVDRGNRRIQKIASDGTWLGELGTCFLVNPTRLALGPDNLVAVVDPGQRAVLLFSSDRSLPRMLTNVQEPRSVTFDDEGRLYIGDTIGLIHVLAPESAVSGGYRLVGAGVTGLDSEIVDLAWHRSYGLLAIIRENYNGYRQRLWRINPAAAFAPEGVLITRRLDSKIERCQWHRIALKASVPAGTSIQIESYTTEDPTVNVTAADFKQWKLCTLSGDLDPDCLVQSGPGRYLWLRFTFRSSGLRSPSLRSIKIFFPRLSYLQYLPAVYQEDEESRLFLERLLSLFQTEFDDMDRRLDLVWQLFDPASGMEQVLRRYDRDAGIDQQPFAATSIEEQRLRWLAAWLALVVNPEWPDAKLREMIKKAHEVYRLRGTVAGLERAVQDYAGVWAKVLEHFRLRRWPALSVAAPLDGSVRLWSRDFYQRLQLTSYSQLGYFQLTGVPEPAIEPLDWGAHKFTVFFPADPYRVETTQQQVAAVVEREKPAHTETTLCPVYPRLRVGIQATVGVDTVVGSISHLVLNRLATLNYDTILACSVAEQQMRNLGSSPRPHLGVSTRLL